jgi:hypothetical protein
MLDQKVLHSVETEIEGMGDVRIRIGETDTWDAPGLMIELQWKDSNNNWVHGRASLEFLLSAIGPITTVVADFVNQMAAVKTT